MPVLKEAIYSISCVQTLKHKNYRHFIGSRDPDKFYQ
jgi:hypothetical protein